MLQRTRHLLASISLGAFVACGGSGDNAPAPAADAGVEPQAAIGTIVSVDQVAVYQGVKVSFVTDGQPVTPNAPVIAKRPALVRVHAGVPARTTVPQLTAELRIRAAGQEDVVVTVGPRTVRRFIESDLNTTFNFELAAEQIPKDAQFSVEVRESTGVDTSVVRYPAEGDVAMNVGPLAPTLHVRFVPIRYQADGSGRMPPLAPSIVEAYRSSLFKMYPVSEIDLTVREPLNWPLEVKADGEGWDTLLDAVMETRQDDKVADDVYYVGVFVPAETQREYCAGGGCILGIAPAAGLGDSVALRTAMIVGYPTERAHGTLAQELAHAMGRLHAPCGVTKSLDGRYPYSQAAIGTWGYDLVTKELLDPDDYVFDFMSYCTPVWISDYTFSGLYNRIVEVEKNKGPDGPGGPLGPAGGLQKPVKSYHVSANGSLRAGPSFMSAASAVTTNDTFVLENAAHETVGKVRGSFHPLSGIGGGILLVPNEIPLATLGRTQFARAITTP